MFENLRRSNPLTLILSAPHSEVTTTRKKSEVQKDSSSVRVREVALPNTSSGQSTKRATPAAEDVPSKRCRRPGPASKTTRDLSRSSSLSASDSSSYPSLSSYSSERSTNNLGSSDSTSATPHSTPTYTLTSRLRMPAKQLHQKHLQTPQKDQPSQGIRFRYVALVPTNDCCSTNT